MRILTVTPSYEPRGTQRVAKNVAVEYARRGYRSAAVAFTGGGYFETHFQAGGVETLPALNEGPHAMDSLLRFAPDVVHIHRAGPRSAPETALLSALRPSVKCILETNVFSRFDPHTDPLIDVHGNLTRVGLVRWNILSRGRSNGAGIYLPNALDVSPFDTIDEADVKAFRARVNASETCFLFGRIGKTHSDLLLRWPELVARVPTAKFVTIDEHWLPGILAQLPRAVTDRITVLPPLRQDHALATFYAACDGLLHWSPNGESFGLVLAESILAGTPVVTPLQPHLDMGGLEVVKHGEGGLVAGSTRAIIDAAATLVRDIERLQVTLRTAQRRMRAEYATNVVVDRALAAIELVTHARQRKQDVRRAIEADTRFECHPPRSLITTLFSQCVGRRSIMERVLHEVSHHAASAGIASNTRILLRRLALSH